MTQYIDKYALVAEIEKRVNFNKALCAYSRADECNAILSLIDTLEVKEVDFDEEFDKFHIGMYNPFDSGVKIRKFAKHFFELGMTVGNKAQKGE